MATDAKVDPTESDGWNALAAQWWNKGTQALETSQVVKVDGWNDTLDGLLCDSAGAFYVRVEYAALYSRLEDASAVVDGVRERHGVVLTGQPGIGKSIFGIYTLLRRLAAGQRVIYIYQPRLIVYFHSGIAVILPSSTMSLRGIPNDVWLLYEPGGTKDPLPERFIHAQRFSIAFMSPDQIRMKTLVVIYRMVRWIMPLWNNEELAALMTHGLFPGKVVKKIQSIKVTLQQQIQYLVDYIGPCPRDIIAWVADPTLFMSHLDAAADRVSQLEVLWDPVNIPEGTSHVLALVDRSTSSCPGHTGSDHFTVRIKSHLASMALTRRAMKVNLSQAVQFFSLTGGHTHSMAGIAFESIALRCISGHGVPDHLQILEEYAQMTKVKTPPSNFPIVFEYSPHHPSHTLVLGGSELQLGAFKGIVQPPPKKAPIASPFPLTSSVNDVITPRTYVFYDDIEDVEVKGDFSKFYVPKARTNPLFDALCCSQGDEGGVVLWVFQVTIRKRHTGVLSGIQLLSGLMERMKNVHGPKAINVKWVLVAPHNPRWHVRWAFAADFDRIGGEVFIQLIKCNYHGSDVIVTADAD